MITLPMVLKVSGLSDRPTTPDEWRKFFVTYLILTNQRVVDCIKDPVYTIFTEKPWLSYEISKFLGMTIITSECPEGFTYSPEWHPVVRFFEKEIDGVMHFLAKKTVLVHDKGMLLMPDGYAVKSDKVSKWISNARDFGYQSGSGIATMTAIVNKMSDDDARWVLAFFSQLNLPWKATFTPMEDRKCFIINEEFISLIDYCIPNWAQVDSKTGLYPRPHLAVGDAIIFSDKECYNIGVEEFNLTHTIKVS